MIVTTIQKLGRALDAANGRDYRKRLEPLRDARVVLIFDECHRSQFGDNHQAIKEFFPKAQLFGFTGTPIFEANASYQADRGRACNAADHEDLFQNVPARVHDHPRHRGPQRPPLPHRLLQARGQERPQARRAARQGRRRRDHPRQARRRHRPSRKFNAILATASINDAIEYFDLFNAIQAAGSRPTPSSVPLNVAAVFSPPADVSPDVKQIQEDLPQEQEDNQHDPEAKKTALTGIIADYNARFGTNHRIGEFDLYYQDVQKRIKDQQFPNADLPRRAAKRSTSSSSSTCSSPASTPSTSTRSTSTRTSSTTA